MKFLKKTLSVGLSLVLCASMTVPAFAAACLNEIDDGGGYRYIDSQTGALKAYQDEDGNDSYDYYLNNDLNLDKTLVIKDGANASIDLNGYNLSLNKDLNVDTGNAQVSGVDTGTKQGSVISVTGEDTSLTVTDKNADADYDHGTGTGTISGGYNQPGYKAGFGGGISVDDNASLDLQGGTITNNVASNGGGIYVGKGTVTMSGNAKIDRNLATMGGGGVYLNTELASRTGNQAVFTMNGGIISNNTASGKNASGNIVGGGGGIGAVLYQESPYPNYVAIRINGGTITKNKAEVSGAGISVTNGKVSIADSTITGNIAKNIQGKGATQSGGGIYITGNKSNLEISDSTISSNEASQGGGVFAAGSASLNMENTIVTKNVVSNNGGGILVNTNANAKVSGGEISENNATNGGGVYLYNGGTYVMGSGKLYNNTAGNYGDDVYKANANPQKNVAATTLKLSPAVLMSVTGKDGKPITGWYWDDASGWGNTNGKYPYTNQDKWATSGTYTGALYLKAAHDKYFDLTFVPGYEDESVENVVVSLEKNSDFPGLPTLTREGYTFSGWTDEKGNPIDLEKLPEKVTENMTLIAVWTENPTEPSEPEPTEPSEPEPTEPSEPEPTEPTEPEPTEPADPTDPTDPGIEVEDPDVPLAEEPDDVTDEVEIDDPAVPLASGPVTRAQFVDYLWRHEGEPAPVQDDGLFEDVTDEHEYSTAMAWAKSIGIIEAYEDGTFGPDELVTVSAVRSILTRFAAYADMTMPALTTLTGAEDEAVLNCDEVLAEFFGEE